MKPWFFMHWSEITEQTDQSLSLTLTYDPEKMPVLKDHFFSGHCLVPAAMTTELFIEAVATCAQVDDCFPIHVEQIKFERAVAIKIGQTQAVKVQCALIQRNRYQLVLTTDLTNKKGKVIRFDAKVAHAVIEIHTAPGQIHQQPAAHRQSQMAHFAFPRDDYYGNLNATHGPLFRSFTGNMYIDPTLRSVGCEFNLRTLENRFSTESDLPFICSPLAIDSVLQAGVMNSNQVESPRSDEFFMKLPFYLTGIRFLKPFKANTNYVVSGQINKSDEQDHHLAFSVVEAGFNGTSDDLVACFDNVALRRAQNDRRSSTDLFRDFTEYQNSRHDVTGCNYQGVQ